MIGKFVATGITFEKGVWDIRVQHLNNKVLQEEHSVEEIDTRN